MMVLRMMSLVAPAPVPRLLTQTAAVFDAVDVLLMVRLRSVAPEFEPSMVTKSAPLNLMMLVAGEPVIVATLPTAGRMVRRLVLLEPTTWLMLIGNVSAGVV